MPTAGTTHHIVLNSIGYMLRHTREGLAYRRIEQPFFASVVLSSARREGRSRPGQDNEGLAAGVVLAFGEGGYTRGAGVDCRTGDGARIAAKVESVSSGAVQFNDMCDFNGTVYAAGQTGSALMIYKYSSGGNSFSEVAGAGSIVLRLAAFGNILWATQTGFAPITLNTSDVSALASGSNAGTPTGLGRSGIWLCTVDAAGATRNFRHASISTGAPATVAFTQTLEDGDTRAAARNYLVALGEKLYYGKDDGLYQITLGASDASNERVVDYSGAADSVNGSAIAAFGGSIYYRVRDRLKRWNGSSETDVTPPPTVAGTGGPATVRHAVQALAASARWLFAVTKSDESTPALELWAYDGERWEHLHRIASASGVAAGAMCASATVNRLLINYYTGAAWATVKMDLRSDSDLPSANFSTTGNYVYLPPVDGGLPDVTKRWHSVAIRGELSATNNVDVEYWDGDSWELVANLTAEGEAAFASTVTGKSLWLRLELNGSSTTSPVVREVGVNFDYLPGAQKVVEFEAVLGPNVKGLDGAAESNSAATLLAALDTCRAAGTVVTLVDIVGTSQSVRVESVEVRPVLMYPESGPAYGWIASVRAAVL